MGGRVMRDVVQSVLEILGLISIGVGLWSIYTPLVWIWGGLSLLLVAYVLHLQESDSEDGE